MKLDKFSIITPTFNRPEVLKRAVDSVLDQKYPYWEMIVVNDSPENLFYEEVENKYKDPRIHFFKNSENKGVNFTRNFALSKVSEDSSRVIFLDDDDYLASNALTDLAKYVEKYHEEKWIMTNRLEINGRFKTNAPKDLFHYQYANDYLIQKRIVGDATHCIEAHLAKSTNFSTCIKNGEEWIYFFDISQRSKLFYIDTNTTITEGYSTTGLNFRKRNFFEQMSVLRLIIIEGHSRHWLLKPSFIFFLLMRFVRAIVK